MYKNIIILILCLCLAILFYNSITNRPIKEQFNYTNTPNTRITHLRNFPKNIYIFWDNGWENAPYICNECLSSWIRHNKGWDIIKLDNNNIAQYLENEILQKINTIKKPQHRADLIRVNLLNKFGGVWVDASIVCNRSLDSWLYEYMKEGIFYFKYNKESGLEHYKIGNWFIACEKNNYLMEKFCQKYNTRWKYIVHDEYFGFHKTFKELCDTNEKFNNIYQSIPFYNALLPRITFREKIDLTANISNITPNIQEIIDNTNIPMFKFSSSEFKCQNENIQESVFYYIIKTNKLIN
jgi:hypothetical protein